MGNLPLIKFCMIEIHVISLKFSPTEYCVAENVGPSLIFNNLLFTVNGQFFCVFFCLKLVIGVVSKLS